MEDQFCLERANETFQRRIVPAVRLTARAADDAVAGQQLLIAGADVVAARVQLAGGDIYPDTGDP